MKQVSTWIVYIVLFALVVGADASAVEPAFPQKAVKPPALGKQIEQFGSGTNALVAVRLRDKSIVSGYISESSPEGFVVANLSTGVETKIAYPQVVSLAGYNFVTGTEVHHHEGLKARLFRAAMHLMPVQPVPQNNLSKGQFLVIAIVAVVVLILIVKLV